MKIAITGGAGFIGSHLTRAYLDAGHDVLVLDNLTHSTREAVDKRARFYQVDIRDEQIRTILRQERPDIVSHHACQPGTQTHALPRERALADADIHIRGLLHVLEACVEAQVRHYIFASGGNQLYSGIDDECVPIREDAAVCPRQVHDISKIAGEWYVRYYTQHYGLSHTILRYADIYGEEDPSHLHHPLSHIIYALLHGQHPVLRETGEEVRDHLFIDDAVQANLLLLQSSQRYPNHTLHISSGYGSTIEQQYRLVTHMLQQNTEPLYLLSSQRKRCATVLDNSRARRLLNWQPQVALPEGIRRALDLLQKRQTEQIQYVGVLHHSSTVAGR